MKKDNVIDQNLYLSLLPTSPVPGRLCFHPKVHKQGNPGRPIISGNGTVTEKLSTFVDFHLTRYMSCNFIPSYIKDTTDFLNAIRKIPKLPDDTLLVAMNVKALYTNIPHKDGIAAVQTTLNRNNVNTTLTRWILRSIECILTNNNFTFNDQYYIQLQDTAMGTKMAPKYVKIFMHVFEEQLLTNAPLKPIAFFRFIDDIVLVWPHGIKALNKFIEAANNLYPTIKFTHCISPEKENIPRSLACVIEEFVQLQHFSINTLFN